MVSVRGILPPDIDQRVFMHGMTWWQYETILAARGENPLPRITYSDGTIELMKPSHRHEERKSLIGQLVEAYLFERNMYFVPWGSTTLKNPSAQKGAEPDESYAFSKDATSPDLVIEAVLTSGGIDKLPLYAELGVHEVWFWSEGGMEAFALNDRKTYQAIEKSTVISGLAISTIAHYATLDDAYEAVQAFREELRGGG